MPHLPLRACRCLPGNQALVVSDVALIVRGARERAAFLECASLAHHVLAGTFSSAAARRVRENEGLSRY